jgi:hypothetical protein
MSMISMDVLGKIPMALTSVLAERLTWIFLQESNTYLYSTTESATVF